MHEDIAAAVLDAIDGDELTALAVELAGVHNPPGSESNSAERVAEWLAGQKIPVRLQELSPERKNVIGRIRGSGGGLRLLFNSHLDSDRRGPLAWWTAGEFGVEQERAWVDGDRVYGKAVVNDRGPMAAWLMAAAAIRRAGVQLKGDILLTSVCGEIGMAPVDEFQGSGFLGKGIGTRLAVEGGALADFAVVGETTDWSVCTIECGCAYFRVLVEGKSVYTPWHERGTSLADHPNAAVKASALALEVDAWAAEYARSRAFDYHGTRVVPKASIGAMRAGAPYSPSRTPRYAALYVDVRLAPGDDALGIRDELEGLARKVGVRADVDLYMYRRGYTGDGHDRLVSAFQEANRQVRRCEVAAISPTGSASMWRDFNVFREVGMPCAVFGPPRLGGSEVDGPYQLYLDRTDLLHLARIYALVALDICSTERPAGGART